MKNTPVLAVVAVLMASGCATDMPETRQYLLRTSGPAYAGEQPSEPVAVLGRVTVASYIDQRGLVLETEGGAMLAANHNLWAEPLRESVRSFLADEIARQAGAPIRAQSYSGTGNADDVVRRIDVRLDQLHGTRNGDAILVAYWAIIDPADRSVVSEHSFSERESLNSDGYDSLVAAESRLLRSLATSIAESL